MNFFFQECCIMLAFGIDLTANGMSMLQSGIVSGNFFVFAYISIQVFH